MKVLVTGASGMLGSAVARGSPLRASPIPTAARSAWIFWASRFIWTPKIVESLA